MHYSHAISLSSRPPRFLFSNPRGSSLHGLTGELEQSSRLALQLLHIGSGGGAPTGQEAQEIPGDSHPARLRGIAGRGLLGQFPFQASAESGLLQRKSRQTGKENFRVTKETASLGACTGTESSGLSCSRTGAVWRPPGVSHMWCVYTYIYM